MSKTNENPEANPNDIVSVNFTMYRHERDTIKRRSKAAGYTSAYKYMTDISVNGKVNAKRK